MVRRSLIIGRTNVGKTLFCINFASYLGMRELGWVIESEDGNVQRLRTSVAMARSSMSDEIPHRTRALQSIRLEVPRGKTDRQILLTDTTGLTDGIHERVEVRKAMAQTLETLLTSAVVLHVVDASQIGKGSGVWSDLDQQLMHLGEHHPGYLLIANKIDLRSAREGYAQLRKTCKKQRLVAVSALKGTGFREVKQHVWKFA